MQEGSKSIQISLLWVQRKQTLDNESPVRLLRKCKTNKQTKKTKYYFQQYFIKKLLLAKTVLNQIKSVYLYSSVPIL